MRLYHGSNTLFTTPDLGLCKPDKDFGRGFYLTEEDAQARKMSHRTTKQKQLIEYVTQDLITMLVERQHLSIEEAMQRFYHSKFYEKLLNPESGLYLEGSEYLYGVMNEMDERVRLF